MHEDKEVPRNQRQLTMLPDWVIRVEVGTAEHHF